MLLLLHLFGCAATTHRVVAVTPPGGEPVIVTAAGPADAPADAPLADLPLAAAPPAVEPTPPRRARRVDPVDPAALIVQAAASFAAGDPLTVNGKRYRDDCSGLIEAALAAAGGTWTGSSASLYDAAREAGLTRRRPRPGDVAFFDNTYDRDGDRRLDDRLTHVAIVENVDRAGTITLIHRGSRGITRLRMNLRHKHWRDDGEGNVYNDYLRARSKNDRPRTRYLAGELWVRFGRFAEHIEPMDTVANSS